MAIEIDSKTFITNDEGYLVDPVDWDKSVAEELARREEITLTDLHWKIINFMRYYYETHHIAADARFVIKFMADDLAMGALARKNLYKLFPYGYVKQACKIAGMLRPRAWSVG